jgi:hypothetical protein
VLSNSKLASSFFFAKTEKNCNDNYTFQIPRLAAALNDIHAD